MAQSLNEEALDCTGNDVVLRLTEFITSVKDEHRRSTNKAASDYFKAARSNSNDTGLARSGTILS